jgi:hypothetical protein
MYQANVKSRQALSSQVDHIDTIWIEVFLHKFQQSLILGNKSKAIPVTDRGGQ